MSLDYHVFVGPFLKCKVGKNSVPKNRFGCAKCLTEVWQVGKKFCHLCGGEHKDYATFETQDAVNCWDLMQKIEEALFYQRNMEDGYHFWFGNKDKDIGYSFDPYETENGYKNLHKDVQDHDMCGFRNYYGNEIAALEEAYGKENVKLLWGVVHTVS